MKHLFSLSILASFIALLVACQPQSNKEEGSAKPAATASEAGIPMVPEANKSDSFEVTASKLDLGGEFYMYQDLDGIIAGLEETVENFMPMIAEEEPMVAMFMSNIEIAELSDELGIGNIRSLGLSSWREGDVFHNKSFFHIDGERKGLLKLTGGAAAPFEHVGAAPAGTDVYLESTVDVASLVESVKAISNMIMPDQGPVMIDAQLGQPVPGTEKTWGEVLAGAKGRIVLVMDMHEERTLDLPDTDTLPVALPYTDFLVAADGLGVLLDVIAADEGVSIVEQGALEYLQLPVPEDETFPYPEIKMARDSETGRFFFASTQAMLDNFLAGKGGLADSADYKQAIAGLPAEGNTLLYMSPSTFKFIAEFREGVYMLEPSMGFLRIYEMFYPIWGVDARETGCAYVSANLPNGIFSSANWPYSNAHTAMMGGAGGQIATVGVMAGVLIPAVGEVRRAATEATIKNDGRQVGSMAQQYFMENGVTTVTAQQLFDEGLELSEGTYFMDGDETEITDGGTFVLSNDEQYQQYEFDAEGDFIDYYWGQYESYDEYEYEDNTEEWEQSVKDDAKLLGGYAQQYFEANEVDEVPISTLVETYEITFTEEVEPFDGFDAVIKKDGTFTMHHYSLPEVYEFDAQGEYIGIYDPYAE